MPSTLILPVAKALYLCDGHIGFPGGKTDLVGIFNSIRPATYPHFFKHFVVYARLVQGLGRIPFFIDIRFAATGQLVHLSNTYDLNFPDHTKTVEMVLTMDIRFPQAGVYLVELYCDNQWVADATLLLQ